MSDLALYMYSLLFNLDILFISCWNSYCLCSVLPDMALNASASVACPTTGGAIPITGTVTLICDLPGSKTVGELINTDSQAQVKIYQGSILMYSVDVTTFPITATVSGFAASLSEVSAPITSKSISVTTISGAFTAAMAAGTDWNCAVEGSGTSGNNGRSANLDLSTFCDSGKNCMSQFPMEDYEIRECYIVCCRKQGQYTKSRPIFWIFHSRSFNIYIIYNITIIWERSNDSQ